MLAIIGFIFIVAFALYLAVNGVVIWFSMSMFVGKSFTKEHIIPLFILCVSGLIFWFAYCVAPFEVVLK